MALRLWVQWKIGTMLTCLAAAWLAGPWSAGPLWSQVSGQLTNSRRVSAEQVDDGTSQIVPTDLVCVVGGEHILAADVFAYIDIAIEDSRGKMTPAQEETVRRQLLRRMLVQYVQIKALYQDFLREMIGNAPPSDAKDKRKQVQIKATKLFYEKQVPQLLKNNNVADVRALEEKLRSKGSSLGQLETQFLEKVLAGEAERKNVPEEVEILPEELVQYYQEHSEKWKQQGQARWRQLTARFDRFSNKADAKRAIEAMGNEIFLGGKPFEAVAKASSHGYSAEKGGLHDWTTQGGLKSKPLDAAIFSIPPNRLSQVIEDDIGYHIIEVIERKDARTVSFDEAHDEMRKAITEQKRQELSETYHKKVMDRTVIWTRWPEDIPGSRSLLQVLAE